MPLKEKIIISLGVLTNRYRSIWEYLKNMIW